MATPFFAQMSGLRRRLTEAEAERDALRAEVERLPARLAVSQNERLRAEVERLRAERDAFGDDCVNLSDRLNRALPGRRRAERVVAAAKRAVQADTFGDDELIAALDAYDAGCVATESRDDAARAEAVAVLRRIRSHLESDQPLSDRVRLVFEVLDASIPAGEVA